MAKKIDPVKAKAAKQKKIAIAGGVLLLALLAFQVPRTMKMLHGSGNVTTSASTAPASTTPTGSTPLAPPTLDGGRTAGAASPAAGGSAVATSADGVSDPSVPLPPSSGQLISFNRFKSKDPFRQQIQDCGTDSCAGGSATTAASGGSGGSSGSSTSGGGTGTSAGAAAAKPSAPTSTAIAPTKRTVASISVNGTVEKVSVGAGFPAADPVFALVGVTAKEAMIGIAGGSLESGAAAVGLKVGKTVKLQNTADGATYVLKLLGTS
jgi:hypothetical protein